MILPGGLLQPPFAHRGLWSPGVAAENSLAALELAFEAGYGAEFDVRLTRDGEVVVFHDETLRRMAGIDAPIAELTLADLSEVPLLGGPDRIPTLAQALELAAGRAMLLVELKAGPDHVALAGRTAELLDRYRGPAAVIGFDPVSLGWLADQGFDRPRGLDAMWDPEYETDAKEELERQIALARPQFLVLERRAAAGDLADVQRLEGRPVIAWTIRSPDELAEVAERCDNFIFEGYLA